MATRKPATRARRDEPRTSPAAGIIGLSVVAAAALLWLRIPAVPAVWLGLLVAAWMEPPAHLTGKDKLGNPKARDPQEAAQHLAFQFHAKMRLALILPSRAWLPGWPVQATFLLAGATAAIAWAQPVADWVPWWGPATSAGMGYVCVASLGHTRRTVSRGFDCPGTNTGALRLCAESGVVWWINVVAALLAAAAAVWALLEYARNHVAPGAATWIGCAGVAVATFTVVVLPWWRRQSLAQWRLDCAARREWEPRWVGLKHDPAPYLVSRRHVGAATLDTFEAPAHLGAATFTPLLQKLTPSLGTGTFAAILDTPDHGSDGQPIAGSIHPTRFQVAQWTVEDVPDVSSPATSEDEVRLLAQASMNQVTDTGYAGRLILSSLEVITTDESPRVAWASQWSSPAGLTVGTLRTREENGPLAGAVRADVLIDHRADKLFFGALTDEATVFVDGAEAAEALRRLDVEDHWNRVWSTSSKQYANPPTIHHSTFASGILSGGQEVQRQVFVTRVGVDPAEYRGTEPRLSASMAAAPFVAVTGWPMQEQRPGERHPQAVCVYWSHDPVPDSPQKLAPAQHRSAPANDPAVWVLAGLMNKAFDAAKLARPEVVTARCLTVGDARKHLWQTQLRLHGGVVGEDVRVKQQKLRQALGVEWLRIADAEDGVTIYGGCLPTDAQLRHERRDRDTLTALDWEQAFLDAKLTGAGGDLPRLVSSGTLPDNNDVEDLVFELPSGLDIHRVRGALDKVKTTTGNTFVEARPAPEGPAFVRLLVCPVNPLPQMCRVDFDAVDASLAAGAGTPFATGVEGQAVSYNFVDDPHALLAGLTGSGKSSQAALFLYGAAVSGHRVVVVDPMKGGADFKFLEPYWWAFADDPHSAAAVMKAVYDEVVRRKNLNAKHGVGSYRDLPQDVRPPHITVFVDEFTSLMGKDPLPPKSDDPEAERERESVEALNAAKIATGVYSGKFGREARSAGVTLLLGTQKLTARLLDTVPGGQDLKTNLARGLLGNSTLGDRQSALRDWQSAPKIEAPAVGRGYWESNSGHPLQVQTWYAGQDEYTAALAQRLEPIDPSQRLDFEKYMPAPDEDDDGFGPPPGMLTGPGGDDGDEVPEVVELGEITLTDLDLDGADDPTTLDEQPGPTPEEGHGLRAGHAGGDLTDTDLDALFTHVPEALPHVPDSRPGDVVGWGDELDWTPTPAPEPGTDPDDDRDGDSEEFPDPQRTPKDLLLTDADPFS